jgi:recombination protein RecT
LTAHPANANLPAEQKPASPIEVFRHQLDKNATEFALALPKHIPLDRFKRVVQTAVINDPKLLHADRASLFASAMKAAQDGLLPDGRDGALVIYQTKVKGEGGERDRWIDKVQWMPMIGGILKKVRNSGELKSIRAHVVHENDVFKLILGDEERLEHEPNVFEPGKPVGAYAIAETEDGIYREFMSFKQVEEVRNVSRAKDSGPWTKWWGEMARKTVLRRLSKRLPMSSDLDDLLRRDDALYDFDGTGSPPRLAAVTAMRVDVNPLADDLPAIEHQDAAAGREEPATTGEEAGREEPASDPGEWSKGSDEPPPVDEPIDPLPGQNTFPDHIDRNGQGHNKGMSPGQQREVQARMKGREAAAQGRFRRIPKEYQGADHIGEANAWMQGYDAEKAERDQPEGANE